MVILTLPLRHHGASQDLTYTRTGQRVLREIERMRRADITVLVELRLLPDSIQKGKRDLLDFARAVRKHESDCSSIEIAQDVDDPTRITMIERWADRAAYEGPHLQTQHMKSFIERSGKYFDGPAKISFCQGIRVGRDDLRPASPYGR